MSLNFGILLLNTTNTIPLAETRSWVCGAENRGFGGTVQKMCLSLYTHFRLVLIKCFQCLRTNSNETIGLLNFVLNIVTLGVQQQRSPSSLFLKSSF